MQYTTQNFLPRLQDHLLERVLNPGFAPEGVTFGDGDRRKVTIQNDRIYRHKVLQVNYTTYDVRRNQDSMNPRTRSNIFTLARPLDEPHHPFSYARLLGVFHADVIYQAFGEYPQSRTIDFAWVHWFWVDPHWKGGFKHRRLYRVVPLPEEDSESYGFLDPDEIIRGAHLIPAFEHGQTISEGDDGAEITKWNCYYVNM